MPGVNASFFLREFDFVFLLCTLFALILKCCFFGGCCSVLR